MQNEQRFSYRCLDDLKHEIAQAHLDLPLSEDVGILATPVQYGRLTVPNRIALQPMEGCDGTPDGAPGELTVRKYRRLAAGGAGMIWFEACAVVPEGRANPRQIWLHEGTLDAFGQMVDAARQAARESMGPGHKPIFVLQLTHSGRYSRPVAKPQPIIAHHSAVLDPRHNLPADYPLITDEQLDALQDDFVRAAILAAQAGFDAVDIKSCHRYLLSELLASFTRENSRYGGSFENRTRMLRETMAKVRDAVGGRVEVTARLNGFDSIAYPYGWGVDQKDATLPDLAEPIELLGQLKAQGLGGVNITVANPYFNPHVNRPADWMIANWPAAPENPLAGVVRILGVARDLQRAHPDLAIIGSGYSWLRHYYPYVAAGAVQQGWVSLAGVGRNSLAYPDFPKDIFQHGKMDPHKVCVACSSCTQIMRDGSTSGCVIRDAQVYGPIYRQGRQKDLAVMQEMAGQCRQCSDAMCVTRCPAGVDIPGFLGALASGQERRAYEILTDANVLPETCGYVCPVEVQCQSACICNCLSGEPVQIANIQRNLSRRAAEQGWAALKVPAESTGRSVAILGAGPAGLAAAATLLRKGHRVVIFDRALKPGGKLTSVIPSERIDPQRVEAEISAIFGAVPADRLQWRLGVGIGQELTLDDVMAQKFDAALLAFGLGNNASLGDAPRPEGVMDASAFLEHMKANADHAAPKRVAVIGGGNSAVDAATLASQRGSQDVYLIYRRSYQQMPAWQTQRDEVLHEGVHLLMLCQPVGYVTDSAGRLAGVKVARTTLSSPDASGRRRPVLVKGSEYTVECELAIEALGETIDPTMAEVLARIDFTGDATIQADPETFQTSREGVFAAGDCVNGGTTVVRAVADGRKAAQRIDAMLTEMAK